MSPLAVSAPCLAMGDRVGVVECRCVAHGAFDAESEEFAYSADVTVRGSDLVEDSIFSECLWGEVDLFPGERSADLGESRGGATMMSLVSISASESCPCAAQIRRIGAAARMWSLTVLGSLGRLRGATLLPLIMTSNQMRSCAVIGVGSPEIWRVK